jgi:hypothetical protein
MLSDGDSYLALETCGTDRTIDGTDRTVVSAKSLRPDGKLFASYVYGIAATSGASAGIDRALNKIKKLCTDPNGGCVFWNAGAQPPELLLMVK